MSAASDVMRERSCTRCGRVHVSTRATCTSCKWRAQCDADARVAVLNGYCEVLPEGWARRKGRPAGRRTNK